MRKSFVALILVPMLVLSLAPIVTAVEIPNESCIAGTSSGIHAFIADAVADAQIAMSLVTAEMPGIIPERVTADSADNALVNWAAILATNSPSNFVTATDGRRLHFMRSYAHIAANPARGSATAATQRTRAVQITAG